MSIEKAGGHGASDLNRVRSHELRDRDGRWFALFPKHWPAPPLGQGQTAFEQWIATNARSDGNSSSRRSVTPTASTRATNGSQARVALALSAARDREQQQLLYELDHRDSPHAVLARAAARDFRNVQYALLLARKNGPH